VFRGSKIAVKLSVGSNTRADRAIRCKDRPFTVISLFQEVAMTHAIRFHTTGGPEVLVWEEIDLGKPGPGEARIRHTSVGLNFVDIYNRAGVYPVALPSGLGSEAAGIVEEIGPGVTDLKPGDRSPMAARRSAPIPRRG
jgi:hypothetical protein